MSQKMNPETGSPDEIGRRAAWLRRLARADGLREAAQGLQAMELEAAIAARSQAKQSEITTRDRQERRALEAYGAALASMAGELDTLIPAWVARLLELLGVAHADQQERVAALRESRPLPPIDMGRILGVLHLEKALRAAGDRIDPHAGPLIGALGSLDRDADEHLCGVLERAGAVAATAAVPKLLGVLREHGVWCHPSHVSRALANAARFDGRVVDALRAMLASDTPQDRAAAMSVLGAIGPAARAVAGQLLAFRDADEQERCGMIYALARLGDPDPVFLDILEAAMRDDNGYVRYAAANALGELTAAPSQFVPLLIDACDWAEPLHDVSLPEAAVEALGRYGPPAQAAMPRLRQFVEGPIKGRTVPPDLVRRAIDRIGGASTSTPTDAAARPKLRPAPAMPDEPLFPVTYQGKQCYVDGRGRLVLQTRFRWGQPFRDGRVIVSNGRDETVVIDREGREVFRSPCDQIRSYSEGLAAIRQDGKWGFVNRDGRVVIEPQYEAVTDFSEGLAGYEVGRREEPIGRRGGASLTVPGRRGFIDRAGRAVIPAEWTDAQPFRDGRALVCTGGTMKPNPLLDGRPALADRKYGFIDHTGRLVVPGDYDLAFPFADGLAVVQVGDGMLRARYGYIDQGGEEVIPLTFTFAASFSGGLALVRRRGKRRRGTQSVIDRTGRVVLELHYPHVQPFSEGLAAVWSGDAFGFIDAHGHWAIEPQFDECEPFEDGVAAVKRGGWYGLIDKTGAFIWGPTTEPCAGAAPLPAWT